MSGIRALTLELQHGSEIPPQPGYYIAYDGWQSPFAAWWTGPGRGWRTGDGARVKVTAWFGPIPERDPRSGALRWPQAPQQSEH